MTKFFQKLLTSVLYAALPGIWLALKAEEAKIRFTPLIGAFFSIIIGVAYGMIFRSYPYGQDSISEACFLVLTCVNIYVGILIGVVGILIGVAGLLAAFKTSPTSSP